MKEIPPDIRALEQEAQHKQTPENRESTDSGDRNARDPLKW
jgi:hypothetical protein